MPSISREEYREDKTARSPDAAASWCNEALSTATSARRPRLFTRVWIAHGADLRPRPRPAAGLHGALGPAEGAREREGRAAVGAVYATSRRLRFVAGDEAAERR